MSDHAPNFLHSLDLLAGNITALRAKGQWSMRALASMAHVSERTLQYLETDHINLSLNTVDKLARALEVSTGSLFGEPVARQEADDPIEAVLAQNIITARRALNLTQEKLGQQSGVSMYVIAHIERQARNPSLHTLAKLAVALHLSLEELLSVPSHAPK